MNGSVASRAAARAASGLVAAAAAALLLGMSAASAGSVLDIYFIDVEGGQATLVVTPARQSLLIDAGYPERGGRDPSRVMAALRDARLARIDYLVVTHFHEDHDGGVAELARQVPIGTFVDNGSPVETAPEVVAAFAAYELARDRGRHLLPKPGDRLPIDGLEVHVVSAGGTTLEAPLHGAGEENGACSTFEPRATYSRENARSIGVRIRFGAFRFLDLGDLVWNKVADLVCPANLIGQADVYLATHHGNGDANVPAFLAAIRPRVAVLDNGPYKGGNPAVVEMLRGLSGTEDVWQIHRSARQESDPLHDPFIANLELDEHEVARWIRLSAHEDGSFTITNGRTGWTKVYEHR